MRPKRTAALPVRAGPARCSRLDAFETFCSRYVAFESCATNLVPGDTNNTRDVFAHDRGALGPVGGIAKLPDISCSPGPNYLVLVGLTATLLALTASTWYARRRWFG